MVPLQTLILWLVYVLIFLGLGMFLVRLPFAFYLYAGFDFVILSVYVVFRVGFDCVLLLIVIYYSWLTWVWILGLVDTMQGFRGF